MIGSIVIDFFRARILYRVAAETSSEALEADALHFGSDMWSSAAVLAGLGAVALGLSVGGLGGRNGRRNFHLRCRMAARPAHDRDPYRYGARGRSEQYHRGRNARSRRSRARTVAYAPSRPECCLSISWWR